MSTDLDFTCPTQDTIGAFVQTSPGFSLAFTAAPSKLDNNPLNVTITPVIANAVTSTNYNTGLYNAGTGIITVPKTGIWAINQTYLTESGNDPFISYMLTRYSITGFTGLVEFINTSDLLQSGLDASNGRSDLVYIEEGTTMQLDAEYTLSGGPGAAAVAIRFSMHMISEL